MSKSRNRIPIFAAISAMLILILDSATAIEGAREALQVCIRTAIPSLFPFFVLSGFLVPYISLLPFPRLGGLLKIPTGWESIFLLGCIGGYPVGAQCVAQGYASGRLEQQQAQRMLGFCTNCGPSFLFGIVGSAFTESLTPFIITAICIGSAILVGIIWPAQSHKSSTKPSIAPISFSMAAQMALRSMASVCAWIIIGKVLLVFLEKWILKFLPAEVCVLFTGLLELTNGCLGLNRCLNENFRFIIACIITSFGGLCVAMQAAAICQSFGLSCKYYLLQKSIQAGNAAVLAAAYLGLPGHPFLRMGIIIMVCCLLFILFKIAVEIPQSVMYNKTNKGGM